MRKQILSTHPAATTPSAVGELDVGRLATALISSEAEAHPIERAFDEQRGPGGSRWVAGGEGEQTLILAFDAPQTIRHIILEVEETEVSRTQELQLAASTDHGQTYREIVRQEFNFSPPHTSFEREEWSVSAQGITHLRLMVKPDKGGRPCCASLTSLALYAR